MIRRAGAWAVVGVGILAVVLAALRAEQQLSAINFRAFDDWRTYAFAVERWLSGAPIYAPVQVAGPYELRDTLLTGFTYPPAAVPLFLPFSLGEPGLIAWVAVNLGGFLLGLFAVLRREIRSVTPLATGLTLLALAAFPPFSNAVVSGNLNLGIAGLLAWAWASDAHGRLVTAAGVGSIMKIFPGLVAVWPARQVGVRAIFWAIAVALAVAVASVPLVGANAWSDFAAALANARPECSPQSLSIGCGLAGLVGPSAAQLTGIVFALVLVLAVLLVRSRFAAYVALGGAMLAPVVDMHPHYWLFAWTVAYVGVVRIVGRRARRRTAAVNA
ncbi:MAG: DUF2029 domain-containing protein [Chloroflexi bacterium]|nr:DUF2029 domain-containing protein [Chloroflexota bacterium]